MWLLKQPVFSVPLRVEEAAPGDGQSLAAWASMRNLWWYVSRGGRLSASRPDDLMLNTWGKLATQVYQAKAPPAQRSFLRRGGRRADLFSIFSGEAAIQETLQMQLLQGQDSTQAAAMGLDELQGPEVPSHPFSELLGGQAGGDLPIARLVPPTRYFVHVEEPRKVLDWLEQGARTGHRMAGMRGGGSYLQHDLIKRYLAELYLPYPLARQLSTLVRQAAVFGPDLFLTRGSDLTLIVDSGGSVLVDTLLQGILGKAGKTAVTAYGETARPAYFARHGQWSIFSTREAEAAAALELARSGGTGSLGDSAEFRYMLSLLPPKPEQRGAFVYLSDPFVREMVGPRTKIAQARRHQARARLNLIASAAALYRLDHGQAATLEELVRSGYVQESWLQAWEGDRITLDAQGIPHSERYGTLARMRSLSELPLERLSQEEAAAYRRYVTNYSRYWRRFFDPIGIRIGVGEHVEMETLILPLVENSIYNQVRALIGGEAAKLSLPALTPQPVGVVSLKVSQELQRLALPQRLGNQAPLDGFGETVHIALYDSHPLLVLGSLDMLGGLSLVGGNFSDMLGIGLLGSILTQPLAVFIELKQPVAAGSPEERRLLARLLGWVGRLNNSNYIERQGDSWVYTFNLENILRFHLYARQVDGYFVLSNRPMEFRPAGESQAPQANARLHMNFEAIQQLRPTLELHQLQHRRQAVLWDQARLLPFLLLDAEDVAQAMQAHQTLYGNRPRLMEGDTWQWIPQQQAISSSLFGSYRQPTLPTADSLPIMEVSPFSRLSGLDLSFRFEDEGVRVRLNLAPR